MLNILSIKAFEDNYIWLLRDANNAVIVDPGQAEPVLAYLQQVPELMVAAILLTHHHADHVAGVEKIKQRFPSVPVYASQHSTVSMVTHRVNEGDCIRLTSPNLDIAVLETPGHTLDHLSFWERHSDAVFCGDTLFSGGCGRVFEGTSEMMVHSLNKLAGLPLETQLYPGHEYTQSNLAFARLIEPHSAALEKRQAEVSRLTAAHQPTVPVSLQEEKATNPFLRLTEPDVIEAASERAGYPLKNSVSVFTTLREWKNMR